METIKDRVLEVSQGGELPCGRALKLAREMGVDPLRVGRAADEQGIRITRCQLGLFGYKEGRPVSVPAEVSQELADEIRARLVDGRLPCAVAFAIAREMRIPPMKVSAAAEALGIRISRCRLGCFP